MVWTFGVQVKALVWKNALLLSRSRWLTVGELLAPVFIMCLLGIIDRTLKYSPPTPSTSPLLSLTDGNPLRCYVFGACTPNHRVVSAAHLLHLCFLPILSRSV